MTKHDWDDAQLSANLPVLRARGENQDLEYMECFPQQARDLAKEIAAFSTSNQGTILIGVSDTGDLVGLADASTADGRDNLLRRIEGICRGTIKPSITPTVKFASEAGVIVLVILVPKGTQPVYYSNNTAYVRHITESRPAEPHEVIEMVRAWLPASEPDTEVADPFASTVSRLASVINDVEIYAEEAVSRMTNPWLDLWQAQCKQSAFDLRGLAVDETAIAHGLTNDLNELADILEQLAHFRLLSGCRPKLERLVNVVLETSKAIRERWIDPYPLSAESLEKIKVSIVKTSRTLSGLCDRAEEMANQGRIEEVQSEASRAGLLLLRASQFDLAALHVDLASWLREVGHTLHLVETVRIYMDGGRSLRKIIDTVVESGKEVARIAMVLSNHDGSVKE